MLRQVQSDRSNLAHGWLPFAADSIRQQFGTQMPQGGHPPHHSITSSAEASSCADSIPRALDVVRLMTGAPPLLFCSGDERVHDMPREPQQPCMISRRNASLHLRLQNLPPHERCVTMPNGPPK